MSWTERLAVFDTETTGTNPLSDRIVTAFVGIIDANGEVERGSDWLADPGVPIPDQAADVHGISTEMAQENGEPARDVVERIRESLNWIARNKLPLVVYNAPFDLTLVAAECRRHGLDAPVLGPQVVDPLVIDRAVDRYRRGKRTLTDTAVEYGVELLDAHDASADAVASGRLALALAQRYPDELLVDLPTLHEKQREWAQTQAASFEDYMRRTRDANFTADRGWPMRALD